ncbi:hypothetical protein MKZ38_007550 [Zalerion maritima]|uniref:Uncharacterized protein n=1 Tax=Zalerion maritima TaxID=339359 RepID=A0AAD5RHT2_9PEZI|nr:hypothetical protein MKZ38_007550 [Zalerion maritima]
MSDLLLSKSTSPLVVEIPPPTTAPTANRFREYKHRGWTVVNKPPHYQESEEHQAEDPTALRRQRSNRSKNMTANRTAAAANYVYDPPCDNCRKSNSHRSVPIPCMAPAEGETCSHCAKLKKRCSKLARPRNVRFRDNDDGRDRNENWSSGSGPSASSGGGGSGGSDGSRFEATLPDASMQGRTARQNPILVRA